MPMLLALHPARAAGPEGFVTQLEERLRAARAESNTRAGLAACAATLIDAFDPEALAAGVVGELPTWPAADRDALVRAIAARLARECRDLLRRPDPGPVRILGLRAVPGGQRVTVETGAGDGPGHIVAWTLLPGGPLGWRAREMVADGRSLIATLRAELDGALAARDGARASALRDLAGEAR